MPIRAVLFDLGNTLWHIPAPPPHEKVREETVRRISALLRSWGIEPEGELFFLGRDIRLTVTEADRRAYEGDGVSPHFGAIVQQVAADKGLSLSREQSEQLWRTWNLEGSFFGRRLLDDALETLEALRRRGYRTGCVTNRPFSGPAFVGELDEHGLSELLDVISISCDVGYLKPHPKIFEHALEALDVPAEEAAMVGDSLRADVGGAQALGLTAVWLRRPASAEAVDGVRPDFVVDALGQVPQLPCFAR